jgi:hypothetical protein
VIQSGHKFGFPTKAGAELRLKGELARQDFDGYGPLDVRVVGQVDDGHTAPAQFAFDFVTGNFLHGHDSTIGSMRWLRKLRERFPPVSTSLLSAKSKVLMAIESSIIVGNDTNYKEDKCQSPSLKLYTFSKKS